LDVDLAQPLPAQGNDFLTELLTFGSGLAALAAGDEEAFEVGVIGKVADDGTNGVGVKVKALGELLGWNVVQVIGFADLVVAVCGDRGLAEQISEFRSACHGSWVEIRHRG
jgi:hypothetical protein